MKNRAFIYLLALLLLVGFILSWYMVVIIRTNMQFQNTGEKLINEIECYQHAYGVLPEEMQVLEWGYDSGVGPFYEKKNDSTYTVYFCLGFDEYYIYDSEQKEWYDFP